MYLGKCEGLDCIVSPTAPNSSVLITGQSGSGKSCRQNQIELAEVQSGNTVIVLDISQNHNEKDIFGPVIYKYKQHLNRIDAAKDGVGINLLSPISNQQGESESYVNFVNSNVYAFSSARQMGVGQQAILREAIETAIASQNKNCNLSDEDALRMAFSAKKKNTKWQVVYQRLWTTLNCGALRSGKKHIQGQKINILDLSGLDILSAETLAEVVLSYFWRMAYNQGYPKDFGKVTIVVDEFQHLSIKEHSALNMILREGRKFGLNLLLTTQSLSIFSNAELSMLNQAATHLCFRPVDNELTQIAKMIDPSKKEHWRKQLMGLKRGQCLGRGNLDINGNSIQRPLLLT